MSDKVKETETEETFYKQYDDEQLQKMLIALMTQNTDSDADTGVQNPIAQAIAKELERRLHSTETKEEK